MRVISGSARGRRLLAPRGMRVRPTADRVKEALFSIIRSRKGSLEGMRVLDLCAGTGGLGIEALSQGAAGAVFVDNHRESADLIIRNIELAGLSGKGKVLAREALVALRELEGRGERFHLIFLDPPYRQGLTAKLLESLAASRLLDDTALVVAEFASGEEIASVFGVLRECDRRRYGDTSVAFFRPVSGSEFQVPSAKHDTISREP